MPSPSDPQSTNNPPRYVNQISNWIETCNKIHAHACVPEPIPQRPPEDVPRWLIDTQEKCIVSGLTAYRYLALSYVWPETRAEQVSTSTSSSSSSLAPPRTLLLDNESMATFQNPGFLGQDEVTQRIPGVIKHALELTAALGERYLWVDRLCIVQDDVGDGGTLSQVSKMDKIYAGAYATIIAAAPEDMFEKGVSIEWPRFRFANSKRQWDVTEDGWYESAALVPAIESGDSMEREEIDEEQILGLLNERYSALAQSRWATRGWTYQEQILCKRAIIFVESGFFWDCHCCVWDDVNLHPGQQFSGVALRADMGQRLATRWWPDFGLYLDLICLYNGREFSYPQDALLGIAGVLNALKTSFPGGFIHGLPRLYLDHALLWQPFGVADRRVDRKEGDSTTSSLPSWSWCGWQCFVDPWSLCSGLSHSDDKSDRRRAGSWMTRNLVSWRLSTGGDYSEPILDPTMLEEHISSATRNGSEIPQGWTRHDNVLNGAVFTHLKSDSTTFRSPIPLESTSPKGNLLATPANLIGSTTTASFFPATLLKERSCSTGVVLAIQKVSAFEDKTFQRGPEESKTSPIVVLRQPNGAFAGLLRLTQHMQVDTSTPLELVAISTGSVKARDMRLSFEWLVFETARYHYSDGVSTKYFEYAPEWLDDKSKTALLFDVHMAFDKTIDGRTPLGAAFDAALAKITSEPPSYHNQHANYSSNNDDSDSDDDGLFAISQDHRNQMWLANRNRFCDERIVNVFQDNLSFRTQSRCEPYYGNYAYFRWTIVRKMIRNGSFFELMRSWPAGKAPGDSDEAMCEFYNVLCVERRDGVAYRRACGWVSKHAWEENMRGPVEVKLG